MGVRVRSSPSYSPFANGIIERHKGILKQTMDKMRAEYPMKDWEINSNEMVLAHSVFAKNATRSTNG